MQRTVSNILYEWLMILCVIVLAGFLLRHMLGKVEAKARTVEAVATIGTLASSLERCYLARNTYAACQGGFFWPGHWSLDVDDPNTDPDAHFRYGIWADKQDWVVAAREHATGQDDQEARNFLAMSSYSQGRVVFCGFGDEEPLCEELGLIMPE